MHAASKSINQRIATLAFVILAADQLTKWMVTRWLGEDLDLLVGFFRLVQWHNTGAAWSLFHGSNGPLAVAAVVALVVLFLLRHQFDIHTLGGQISMGLIFGGIAGNLLDRLLRGHVVDFLYFHVVRRDGLEAGFPAFNVADSGICIGVGLLFVLSMNKNEPGRSSSDSLY